MKKNPVDDQIAEFLGKYTPGLEAELHACRDKLRARFQRGYELVFDNYNALVFGISPTERASDSFVSVAGYPRWVTLFFLKGTSLSDPDQLLEGKGSQIRGIRLRGAADLDRPAIQALISQAAGAYEEQFRTAPPLKTVIKLVSARQRPRRPGKAG